MSENDKVRENEELGHEEKSAKKMKLESTDDSNLNEKIKNQVEYYFSNVNLVKDRFLLDQIKKGDGWVELSTLLTFSKLKNMTREEDRLVQALRESSEIVEIDETKKVIKRKEPLPDFQAYKKQVELRTVHISGFPSDYNFEALRQFCLRYGEVESLAMRRHFKTKFFKGCIHVVFKNEEDAKKVIEMEILNCKDRQLKKESMMEYYRRKEEMRQKRANKKQI